MWSQRMWRTIYSVFDVLPFKKKYNDGPHWCKPVKKLHPKIIVCQYCNMGAINTNRFIRTGRSHCPYCHKELSYQNCVEEMRKRQSRDVIGSLKEPEKEVV